MAGTIQFFGWPEQERQREGAKQKDKHDHDQDLPKSRSLVVEIAIYNWSRFWTHDECDIQSAIRSACYLGLASFQTLHTHCLNRKLHREHLRVFGGNTLKQVAH